MPLNTTQLFPSNMIAVVVGTSNLQLIGSNPTRNGLLITNLSGANTISIANRQFTSFASLAAGTITIPVSSSICFGLGLPTIPLATWLMLPFAWTDAVNAIASGASTNCTVTEF